MQHSLVCIIKLELHIYIPNFSHMFNFCNELFASSSYLLLSLITGLNSLQSGLHKQQMKDLFVELCLTVPVRLSSLLPYLPMLMDPLVSALNGSQTLISQVWRNVWWPLINIVCTRSCLLNLKQTPSVHMTLQISFLLVNVIHEKFRYVQYTLHFAVCSADSVRRLSLDCLWLIFVITFSTAMLKCWLFHFDHAKSEHMWLGKCNIFAKCWMQTKLEREL